ncbi:MAG TPA: hypothetical protein VM784_07735 [Actinomycetota bacterium]|nr:hypothetical protein [Actinomycetota bacterium]
MNRFVRVLPWLLFGFSAILMIAGRAVEFVVLEQAAGAEIENSGLAAEIALGLAFLSFPAVGALIAARQPDNSIGWLLCVVGLLSGIGVLSMAWGHFALDDGRDAVGGTAAAWITAWFWYPLITIIPTFLLLLFPTGHLPSRRWRPVAWAAGGLISVVTVAAMLQEWLIGDTYRVRNPIGIIAGDVEQRLSPLFLSFVPVILLCVLSLIVRFVRGRGQERQQLKWAAAAALVFPTVMLVGDGANLPDFLFPVALITLPAAIGVAILKYRLYDIDVIINRALVYSVLTAVLVGLYAGGVLVFRALLDPVTGDNDVAIAASTLAVAAAFRPARHHIQAFIDHRFYRSRYDSQKTLEEFSARLRDEVDIESLSKELVTVVADTVKPSHASVWLVGEGLR